MNLPNERDKDFLFQEAFSKYKRKVLNTALGFVHNLQDAEEITQDVFVTVYFEWLDFKELSSIGTWIYRITVNKSLDVIRKKKRKKNFAWLTQLFHPESGEELHYIPDFNHPGVQMENKESVSILFSHMEKLPEKQRSALVLSAIVQLSYEEISQIMNTSISAVESLLFRARQNLKKEIGQELKKANVVAIDNTTLPSDLAPSAEGNGFDGKTIPFGLI